MLELQLRRCGFEPVMATDLSDAQDILTQRGVTQFDCVVTDYTLPGGNGLDLLAWLRAKDATLSSILMTATGERQVVLDSLRAGASDFIEKPYRQKDLAAALQSAVKVTRDRRRLTNVEADTVALGQTQRRLLNAGSGTLANGVAFCHHPKHGAGGDFFNVFPLDRDRLLVLLADVSGHDLQAAFVSAYFQGIVRGMLEKQADVKDILAFFNTYLIREWNESTGGLSQIPTSLAVCALVLNRQSGEVTVLNSGAPAPRIIGSGRSENPATSLCDGLCSTCSTRENCDLPHGPHARHSLGGGHPLGWFEESEPVSAQLWLPLNGGLILWTDGLEEHAQQLGVSSWSLAHRFLASKPDTAKATHLAEAPDDILVVCLPVGLDQELDCHLLLDDQYPGSELAQIDRLQARWHRSLRLALTDANEQRLEEIILCLREATINGLRHGCGQRADQCMRLTIELRSAHNVLRVTVADPGPGHSFDWRAHEQRALDELIDQHRGLSLIHSFANAVHSERNGACLTLEFNLTPIDHWL